MKRIKLLLPLAIAMLLGTSCGEKDPDNGKVYDPEESREIFEEVINRFSEKIDVEDINKIAEFSNTIVEMVEASDVSAIAEWAAEIIEDMEKVVTKFATKADVYAITDFEAVYSLAKFKGHFELKDNVWIRSDADDLQFIMKDASGKQYSLKLVTSGKTSTVELYDYDDVYEYDRDWNQDGIISEYEKDGYFNENDDYVTGEKRHDKVTVIIPENIELVAKLDSEEYINLNLHTAFTTSGPLDTSDGADFDVLNSAIASINGDVKLLDYLFRIKELKYGEGKPAVGFKFAKGSEDLLELDVKANGLKLDPENTQLNKLELFADLLGDIQFKGTVNCKDIIDLEFPAYDEALIKKNVGIANDNIDIGVYFGNSTRQATLQVAAFFDSEHYSWLVKPVIVFEDGTSYTFGDYFSEINYDELLKKIEEILEAIEEFGAERDVPPMY